MRSIEPPNRDDVRVFGQTVKRPPSITIGAWQEFWQEVKNLSEADRRSAGSRSHFRFQNHG